MLDIGAPELIIVLVVALIVLGPKRLPEMGASLGRSLREFRHAVSETTEAVKIGAAPTTASAPNVLASSIIAPNVIAPPPTTSVGESSAPPPDASSPGA